MNKDYTIEIERQEFDDVGYDFVNVPIVVTPNLIHQLSCIDDATPQEILFLAHTLLLEKYNNSNIDYLQVFHLKKCNQDILTFWGISNKELGDAMDEPYSKEFNLCFLLPEDY